MREVAARAQHDAHRAARAAAEAQPLRHAVEQRAAAGGREDLGRARERAARVERLDEAADAVEERVDGRERRRLAVRAERALEPLDAGEHEPRRGRDGLGDRERLLLGAAARARPAELDQHRQRRRAPRRAARRPRPSRPARTPRRRRARSRSSHAISARAHELVGEDHPPRAGRAHHRDLLHGRGGHPPGAGVELAPDQLRRHRRLAVRRERQPALGAPARASRAGCAPAPISRSTSTRQREVAATLEALAAQLADRRRRGDRAEPAVAAVDALGEQLLDRRCTHVAAPYRVQALTRIAQTP